MSELEKLHVPSGLIVTNVFAPLVPRHAHAFGLEELRSVSLPHPVANRTGADVETVVGERICAIVAMLLAS